MSQVKYSLIRLVKWTLKGLNSTIYCALKIYALFLTMMGYLMSDIILRKENNFSSWANLRDTVQEFLIKARFWILRKDRLLDFELLYEIKDTKDC